MRDCNREPDILNLAKSNSPFTIHNSPFPVQRMYYSVAERSGVEATFGDMEKRRNGAI
jgi:hypothetical protein